MTREEAIKMAKADLKCMERDTSGQDEMCNSHKCDECSLNYERGNMGEQKEWLRLAIKALEQEPSRDMEEIEEVINCDADAETKCKMISNILTAKPHYFEKQEPSKPMVEIDLYSVIKQKYIEREVLDEIRAEIYNTIEFERKWLCDAGHTSKDIDIALNAIKSKVKDVLEKGAESEDKE